MRLAWGSSEKSTSAALGDELRWEAEGACSACLPVGRNSAVPLRLAWQAA
jgi:hypothetical protein